MRTLSCPCRFHTAYKPVLGTHVCEVQLERILKQFLGQGLYDIIINKNKVNHT